MDFTRVAPEPAHSKDCGPLPNNLSPQDIIQERMTAFKSQKTGTAVKFLITTKVMVFSVG
jgi:hypothetical protein